MPSIEVFNRFDQAALEEARRAPPKDFKESIRRLGRLIDLLPQRGVIEDKHAERWLNRCIEMAIVRMELEHGEDKASIANVHEHVLWHVRRASAIGGSEIGTVVRHFRGEKGGFSNARNLVLEKLLIMAPQPGDEAMNRGVRAEPWIQRMFLEENNATSDIETLDVLKGFRWDKAPQIVGTPDDIIIHPNGRRKIHDYKCPSADVNAEYEKKKMVSFDYQCQVHQYGIFCREAGIEFDGMEIDCFDPRTFTIVPYEIPYDPALEAEMIEGADMLWNEFVMKGQLPVVPGLGELKTEDEAYREAFRRLTMQASVLKVIGDELTTRQKEVLDRVKAVQLEAHELDEGKIDLEFASFDRKRSWDEEVLTNLAEAVDIDVEDFRVTTKKFDSKAAEAMLKEIFSEAEKDIGAMPRLIDGLIDKGGMPYKKDLDTEALIARLEEEGVDVTPAAGISESFTLSRKKAHADKVAVIKAEAMELSDTIENIVEDNTVRLLNGEEQPMEDMEP